MIQLILTIDSSADLDDGLAGFQCPEPVRTVFVQIYSSVNKKEWLESLARTVVRHFPNAVIAGATTNGEIINGYTTTGKTAVLVSFFRSSDVELVTLPCCGSNEKEIGKSLCLDMEPLVMQAAGILLLCTAASMDSEEFLKPLSDMAPSCPVFGAAAGYYKDPRQSFILCGTNAYDTGIAVVLFRGKELVFDVSYFFGWKPFSKEMTVTAASGKLVEQVDSLPAFSIYRHYLGIENDDEFSTNAVGFSFLVERRHGYIARVPISVTDTGGILFAADIAAGEKFRIGYADPSAIMEESGRIQKRMKDFKPDAVFMYSGGSRRLLLRDDIEQETLPFAEIAPTAGFYSGGEYYASGKGIELLNAASITVGIREGLDSGSREREDTKTDDDAQKPLHPYSKAVGFLIRFIEAVTKELEEANKQLLKLATLDKLTGLYNRRKLDEILAYEVSRTKRHGSGFSVILTDIDFFKKINDEHGHLTGDKILIELSEWLRYTFIRKTDIVGRWGGEEFLCIIPDSRTEPEEKAESTAADFVRTVSEAPFFHGLHITCSAGVTTCRAEDTTESIIARVDEALYASKQQGRNRVTVC